MIRTLDLLREAIARALLPLEPKYRPGRQPELAEQVAQAREQWVQAHNYFDSVSDPGLVDHAIFLVNAAERRYRYMLRLARQVMHSEIEG